MKIDWWVVAMWTISIVVGFLFVYGIAVWFKGVLT